jgi:ubiquinone/menaquinone biosynthesis C-methylase UbiE
VSGFEYYLDPVIAAAYDDESPGLPGDVDFYVGLAREAAAAGHAVLELASGTGRVAIPIARKGISIVGLDRSPAMLQHARQKGEGLANLRLIEGDMRDFHLDERFGLVFIPYRSFLHLLTVEDQKACLACIREHLVEGGRFALNFFNPNVVMIAEWLTTRSGSLKRVGRVADTEVWASRDYDTGNQVLDELRIREAIGEG